jgi:hypothetical protein
MEKLACGFFDGAMIRLDSEPDTPETATALQAFLRLGPEQRFAESRHVYTYYRDFHTAVGGEDWLDAQMGIPTNPEDIWRFVYPKLLMVETDLHSPAQEAYVVIEAACEWEEEHGLMLCFRAGLRLTKCGGYDGQVTNVNAYADPQKANVVYAGTASEFTTYLDP